MHEHVIKNVIKKGRLEPGRMFMVDMEKGRIVGDDEADIKNNLISVNSPIARGLIGKELDDTVTIQTPSGTVEVEIIEVEYI